MNSSQDNTFKLQKRVRLISKFLGYKSALELTGAEKLGQGVSGAVFSSGGAAVKVAQSSKSKQSLENEAKILSSIGKSKVAPKLIGSGKGYLAIQKFDGVPLQKHLSKINSDPVFADYICRRTIEAIGALHRKNIAQRDLHGGNIFVTDNYEIKIIDYGQATKGYPATYFETFFGSNTDPTMGALSLVGHLFENTRSYQTYVKLLRKAIENICNKRGADPDIIFTDYLKIEGNDQKESEYFNNLEKITSPPTDSNDVDSFYNSLDSALRINTKNPLSTKSIKPKTSLVSGRSNTIKSINKKPSFSAGILKFEQGGIVPEGKRIVELHGEELVLPKKAIQKITKQSQRDLAIQSLLAYGVFPSYGDGIDKAKKIIDGVDYWLVPSLLPDYYDGIDSDLLTGRATPGILSIREILTNFYKVNTSASTQSFTDTSISTTKEELEFPTIPPAHYIQGTTGKWNPEFESDIDHAIYFAGKSPLPKGAKQKEILNWLLSRGLTYQQIKDHRKKVLEKINETINLPGVEEEYPYVYIDAVDQDFVLDYEDEDDYLEDEEDLDGLDELLDIIKSDDEKSEEEASENIEEEILDATQEDEPEEDPLSDEDLKKLLDDDSTDLEDIVEKLQEKINKPKKESSYTSNKKIFDSITVNFGRIQATLDIVNRNLEKQNELIKASIETQIAVGELISDQTNIMDKKFDLILKQFELQNAIQNEKAENDKKRSAENALEAQRDSAGVADYKDLTKPTSGGSFIGRLLKYLKAKLTRKLYRKLPKSVRNIRRKVRNLQRLPGRIKDRALKKVTQMLPSKGKEAIDSLKKLRNVGGMSRLAKLGKIAGPARYALAGLEYAERKESGQSEVQALSGVGSGLAGAAAGGALGAKSGAALGGAIGALFGGVGAVPGAAIGAVLGGLLGAIGGGVAGSSLSDKITGADKIQGKHETGSRLTKPGTAILHGTEAVVKKDSIVDMSPMSSVGGIMLASTTQYINSVGPIASPIAPTFQSIAAQMARQYEIPPTVAQTNVGGTLPSLGKEIKKVRQKGRESLKNKLSGQENNLLETQNPESFADKLLKMLDPEGKFKELLERINQTGSTGLGGEVGADPFVLLSGSQDPGQAGIDFTLKGTQNRAVLAGQVIEIKHQYNPNTTGGDGRKGSGYGNYVVIRSTNPLDGSQVDMLYAHFPKGEIKVKVGDRVSVGQDLGRMATAEEFANPITRREVGSGTGAHTSLDFFKPGSNQAHPKARALGDYILKELRKGSQGSIEKARQQAYQQQQQSRQQSGTLPTAEGLGLQGAAGNKDFGATSGVGSKGYLIVPGHAAGGGAPEEKRLVKQLARNAYTNLKSKFPDANIHYEDTDNMFEDNEKGFKKQLNWFKQKEKEGWEILEVHMDASIESGQGTGRGVIVPTGELNPVEAYFAKNYGAFSRGHRDLGAPKRGVGLFELGNMSPELQRASKENKLTKQQLDALTAPLERAVGSTLNISPPSSSSQNPKFQSRQGGDKNPDTKYLIINQTQNPNTILSSGNTFAEVSPGRWESTAELSTTLRKLYMQRLGQ